MAKSKQVWIVITPRGMPLKYWAETEWHAKRKAEFQSSIQGGVYYAVPATLTWESRDGKR